MLARMVSRIVAPKETGITQSRVCAQICRPSGAVLVPSANIAMIRRMNQALTSKLVIRLTMVLRSSLGMGFSTRCLVLLTLGMPKQT